MRWLPLLLLGCAAPRPQPLTVHAVEWNPHKVDVGRVTALAESGEDLYVFGSTGAHVLAGGAIVGSDPSVKGWRAATTMTAVDGNGTWVVALDDRGRLFRVRDRSKLEPIASRFGLEGVRELAQLGPSRVAFRLDHALAIADGDHISRYDYAFTAIAGGGGHGAGLMAGGVRLFDPFRGIDRTFAIAAQHLAFDGAGRLVVASNDAILREDGGNLKTRYRGAAIGALAAAGERVWFRDGEELGVLDAGATSGLHTKGTLIGSPTGDVWTLADGALARYSLDRASVWQTAIAPIFSRVCATCHAAGTALDLSTPARWDAKRAAIAKRVVQEKTMPPAGHPLTEAELAAIATWTRER